MVVLDRKSDYDHWEWPVSENKKMLIEVHKEKSMAVNGIQLPEKFVDALKAMSTSIDNDRRLSEVSIEARRALASSAEKICLMSGGLVTFETRDNIVTFAANDRFLTFVQVNGFARDSRLPHPRCMQCARVLIYSHFRDDAQGIMRTSYRIYPDGVMSDGFVSWSLQDSEGLLSYLANTLARLLLANELVWSDLDDVPESFKVLPLVGGMAHLQALGNRRGGVDCFIAGELDRTEI